VIYDPAAVANDNVVTFPIAKRNLAPMMVTVMDGGDLLFQLSIEDCGWGVFPAAGEEVRLARAALRDALATLDTIYGKD
jgi:hypothetical protein